jgi:hypothetical protein
MQNITLHSGNNAQNILPVPFPKNPTPSVESPNNYGNSPYPMALKANPTRKNDQLQYCNFLEPSPRNQALNVPYEGNKTCPNFKTQPFSKDSCYLMDSKAQGVVGIVCNQAGGSNNANFYRGGQFGVDYPLDYNKNMNKKKLEYTVENPVQLPMELENPSIVYDSNVFYPEPSFHIRKNKNFLTYPLQPNYTVNGLPKTTYPYKVMNPIYEKFGNQTENQHHRAFFMLIIGIILICFAYL